MDLPATRAQAQAALAEFLPRAGRLYTRDRNQDWGPDNRTNVSVLSPAIRRRLISEREVIDAACTRHGFQAAEKFVQEVVWRTYWKGWLEARPAVWRSYRDALAPLQASWGAKKWYLEAVEGRTGIDCFDAWVEELETTGYLHNHARMWFASIWIFTLNLPWQLGADFFFSRLLDADPASNTLSWRWVAGLQTVGKNYVARASNIRENTNGRFDPRGQLNESPQSLPADQVPGPSPLPDLPDIDPARTTGYLVTTEDLSAETFLPRHARSVAVIATDRIGGDPSAHKRRYVEAALDDGVARAAAAYGVPVTRTAEASFATDIVGWAHAHAITQVLTAYAPVGPVADFMGNARANLARAGITLVPVQRPWDTRAWPHARKGFFQMKEKIPQLLQS